MRHHARGAHERPVLFQLASTRAITCECRGKAERSIDCFHEVSLFAEKAAWSVPWRNSHALPGLTSSGPGNSRKRRDCRMQSNPRPHCSYLRGEENIRQDGRRIEE